MRAEDDLAGAQLDEDLVELVVVLDVFRAFFAGDQVQRRLGNVEEAALHELRHVAAEEGEQQGADVRAVDIGVGHDDDFMVTDLSDVE